MKLFALTAALGVGLVYGSYTIAAQQSSMEKPVHSSNNRVVTQSSLLSTQKAKVSYSIGVDLGTNFKEQGIVLDPDLFRKGLEDGMNHHSLLTQDQMIAVLNDLKKTLIERKKVHIRMLANKNKHLGDAFLTKNRVQPGIITTASGLQYKIINPGKGKSPTDKDVVTVDYTGMSINGVVFDKSKTPITFPVSGVIPGWIEILKLMKPGATFQAFIPSKLAYGEHGFAPTIEPNQTLVFTIHLLDVGKSDAKTKTS